jgi:hypothetical protein
MGGRNPACVPGFLMRRLGLGQVLSNSYLILIWAVSCRPQAAIVQLQHRFDRSGHLEPDISASRANWSSMDD